MINISAVTRALETLLKDHPTIKQQQYIIVRGEKINENPDLVPWLGIYRRSIDYDPTVFGLHSQTWVGDIKITMIIQESSLDGGDDCEERLEKRVQEVMDVVLSDVTLNANVEVLTGTTVSYTYNEVDEETLSYQNALIDLIFQAQTGGV